MANSIFASGFFGVSSSGGGVNVTLLAPFTGLFASHAVHATDDTGELVTGNNGFIYWLNRACFTSPADSQINFTNNAVSVGVGIDVATDAVMKIRTRAQTGYATVDCLGLKASGSAGANFGPSAVASLTVVNGIVTAAS